MADIPEEEVNSMRLVHEGQVLGEKAKSLFSCNIKDNDLLAVVMSRTSTQGSTGGRQQGQRASLDDGVEIERVRQHILDNPTVQAQLRQVRLCRASVLVLTLSRAETTRAGGSCSRRSCHIRATDATISSASVGTPA